MKQFERLKKRKLGELLVDDGYVTEEQLRVALELQKASGDLLGKILVEQGYLTERALARAMATQLQLPFLSTENYQFSKEIVGLIPPEICHRHELIPLDRFGNCITILMSGFPPIDVLAQISQLTNCEIFVYIGTSSDVQNALKEWISPDSMTQADVQVDDSWMNFFDKANEDIASKTEAAGPGE